MWRIPWKGLLCRRCRNVACAQTIRDVEWRNAVLNACDDGDGGGPDDASCSSGGLSDRSLKRRRPDAVITTPLDPTPKRGKHGWRMKPAGWLLGQPERRRHDRMNDGPGPRGQRPSGPGGPGRRGFRGRGWGNDGFSTYGRQSRRGW